MNLKIVAVFYAVIGKDGEPVDDGSFFTREEAEEHRFPGEQVVKVTWEEVPETKDRPS